MATSSTTYAFLGAGSMGGAILTGFVKSGAADGAELIVTNRSAERASTVIEASNVTSVALEHEPGANTDAAAKSRVVILGVKPAMIDDVLREIAPVLRDDAIVVSLAAGVTLATFEDILGDGVAVVRAMPNTPAIVGSAVTGIVRGSSASDDDVVAVRRVFEAVGRVVEIPESKIDALGAISGSGPAYFYFLVERFTDVALDLGFSTDEARSLVEGTFLGSALLLADAGEAPAELRRAVTSPKGTTERAIEVLERSHVDGILGEAIDAAIARSRELSARP